MRGALRAVGPAKLLVTGATALVLLGSSLVGLMFAVWPALKPDPRDVVGARATVLTIERNVTVRDWLTRTTNSRQDLARRVRAWERQAGHTDIHGELAYVRLSLHGFKGDQVRVRWSIYYDRSRRPASHGTLDPIPDTIVTPAAPANEFVIEQWMQPVPGPVRYFARFELRTKDGQLLDLAQSGPFRGV
jgi:hypothetical protein